MRGKEARVPHRIREIRGTFAFIEHRFLRQGYFQELSHHEILLYLFLILVSNRKGLSWYGYEKICLLLRISQDDYHSARQGLIDKDLIAFDGYVFQVLSLPDPPGKTSAPREDEDTVFCDATDIARLVDRVFSRKSHP